MTFYLFFIKKILGQILLNQKCGKNGKMEKMEKKNGKKSLKKLYIYKCQ